MEIYILFSSDYWLISIDFKTSSTAYVHSGSCCAVNQNSRPGPGLMEVMSSLMEISGSVWHSLERPDVVQEHNVYDDDDDDDDDVPIAGLCATW